MSVNIDQVLGAQMLFQSAATAFVHRAVAQVLVTITAIRHVLFQGNVNVVRLFEMMLNGFLRAKVAVAILAMRHGVV